MCQDRSSLHLIQGGRGGICHLADLSSHIINGLVNAGLVLEEEGPHDGAVNDIGAIELGGGHAPHQEETLGKVVERHPGEEDVREELYHGENRKHHPVYEPTGVILFTTRFQGLKAVKGGIDECNEVADEFGSIPEDEVDAEDAE